MKAAQIIAPESGIWTPERGRRRRTPTGPPLCSTTFGGSTIPPLFGGGGGGGFLQGDIFIRSVGNHYWSGVDGVNQQNIPQPTIVADDDLFVVTNGSGTSASPVNAGDWVNRGNALFGRYQLWHRKATGGGAAADQFTFAAHTNKQVAVMASFSNVFDVTDQLFTFQGGFLRNEVTDGTWPVGFPPGNPVAMTANTGQDPQACVFLFSAMGRGGTGVVAPSVVDVNPAAPPLETVAEFAEEQFNAGPDIDSLFIGWYFQYLPVSIAYPSFLQGFSPATFGASYSQYQRMSLV